MAKTTEQVRQEATPAVQTPAPVIPYSKRIGFALLSKPFQSKDKKRRYIGLASYQIGGTDFHATAQISVLSSESGKQTVEIMFPTGRYGAADPIIATSKDAQEAFRLFLKSENEHARDWVRSLPNVKDLLTADLAQASSGGAEL